ncbi:MAG TPA: anthranilate synthase component I family protein [Thermoanaerobaculia bacterium]
MQLNANRVLVPLREQYGREIVFRSRRAGAALLEGWRDEGGWLVLLPWPEETRTLAWSDVAAWHSFLRGIEADVDRAGSALDRDLQGAEKAPFMGGWAGFISYEAMCTVEDAEPRADAPAEPAAFFARHEAGILVSPSGEHFLFAREPEIESYRLLLSAESTDTSPGLPPTLQPALHDSLGDGLHEQKVETIRELIRDGEVYQVNLTRAFTVEGSCETGALYGALTGRRPPRSSAWIQGEGWTIASASPEVLLTMDRRTGVAESRPIKGTVRRRGDGRGEISELLASEKDAAEHLMIVDVARNDLGKVAPAGCVSVSEFRAVRSLEHLHHLESTIRAEGLQNMAVADVLRALSPAASITGAPKRAAVHAIREIEPAARGVYCGSIGFLTRERAEFSVAIRTAVMTEQSVRYHAGGGIVWDSNGAAEDDECRVKAEAFLAYFGLENR